MAESSQLRIKGEASKGDTVVGVCYSSPDQGEEMDEALLKQGILDHRPQFS